MKRIALQALIILILSLWWLIAAVGYCVGFILTPLATGFVAGTSKHMAGMDALRARGDSLNRRKSA